MSFWSDKSVLVTGGAGLIGSALVWALNRADCENIVVSDLLGTSEKWRNLVPLRFHDYVEGDDLLAWLGAGRLPEFTHIFHLGACSATTERDSSYLMRNNFELTKFLARSALASGARFVYASSAATYGDGSCGMSDAPELSLDRLRPLNAYGYSKHLFDLHAQREGFLGQITGLKYFNVFGPNEDHKGDMRSVVHKAFGQVSDRGVIELFKSLRPEFPDGGQMRDFLYVKDAVAMTLHLAATPGAFGLFNIGSGEARTWLELANAVFEALERNPDIRFIDMPEALQAKYQYHTCAEISRLRATGYTSSVTSLRDAVLDYVRHYLIPGVQLGDAAMGLGEA